jgi:tetratricopeptide (TPR) repeat protein
MWHKYLGAFTKASLTDRQIADNARSEPTNRQLFTPTVEAMQAGRKKLEKVQQVLLGQPWLSWLSRLVWTALIWLGSGVGQPALATEVVLTLPFEHTTARPEYNWIRESFTVALAELLDAPGLIAVPLDECHLAYEKLGLPRTALLTRATEIKLGEIVGADLLVRGTYMVTGEGKDCMLTVRAQMISLREGKLIGSEHVLSAPVANLQVIQGKLAWELLYQRNPALPFSRDRLIARATRIAPTAYEIYVKALVTEDPADRARLLIRAIEEATRNAQLTFPQAYFELGLLHYRAGRYGEAMTWLERIRTTDPRGLEASFYLGVCQLLTNQTEAAIKTYKALLTPMPLFETYVNAGVAYMQKGDFAEAARLTKLAADTVPLDDDTLFNYAYALWRDGRLAEAVTPLETLTKRTVTDGRAWYVLSKVYAKLGRTAEAAVALDAAKRHAPDFAKWETAGKPPWLPSVKTRFNREAFHRYARGEEQSRQQAFLGTSVLQRTAELMRDAQAAFLENRSDAALEKLAQIIQLAPDHSEAHLLLGRIHERRGDLSAAIQALKAAVFWNPKLTAAHVLLGRILLTQGERTRAAVHIRQALELNPDDPDAQAAQRLLLAPPQ